MHKKSTLRRNKRNRRKRLIQRLRNKKSMKNRSNNHIFHMSDYIPLKIKPEKKESYQTGFLKASLNYLKEEKKKMIEIEKDELGDLSNLGSFEIVF